MKVIPAYLIVIVFILLACDPIPTPGGGGDPGNVNNGSCTATTALTVKNKPYGTDVRQKADMFLPANRTCTTPAVLLVTGGIWAYSSRTCDKNDFVVRLKSGFKQRGYAVITMDYRYATGNPLDQLYDLKNCVDSISAWSNRYVFSDRIQIIGESSGAYLAMMYALQFQNPKTPSVVAISPIMDFADTTLIRDCASVTIQKFTDASCGFWILPTANTNLTLFDLLCDYVGTAHYPDHDIAVLSQPCINPLSIVKDYPLSCAGISKYAHPSIPDILMIHGLNDGLVPPHQSIVVDSLFSSNPAFSMQHQLTFLPYAHGYLGSNGGGKAKIDSVTYSWINNY